MNFTDARKILGLGPHEDPRPFIADFHQARERIAEMVRIAPTSKLGDRYQEDLIKFDRALAALREYLEALGLNQNPSPPETKILIPELSSVPTGIYTETYEDSTIGVVHRGRMVVWFGWFLIFLMTSFVGVYFYYKNEENKKLQVEAQIVFLQRESSIFLENRRWEEAAGSFGKIEILAPGSELAKQGRHSIESGMAEEQTQFVGYWSGQAVAELDAGRLDEAQSAAAKVLEKFPQEKEINDILCKITVARAQKLRDAEILAARKQFNDRQWQDAIHAAQKILASSPDNSDAKLILVDSVAALEKFNDEQLRARELFEKATARDHGQFDQQALDWYREAATLSPENKEISERLEIMASYTRTLRVPGDFASPAEALAEARNNDRIVLDQQVWKGPLIINSAIELQGAGSGKTIIECLGDKGCAITIGPDANGVRISGITFRHESFLAVGADRFSAALVTGGSVNFIDCDFSDASGHGLAVIEKGKVVANRCRFVDNGWNGAAAIGIGVTLEIRESESHHNFEHGIESWSGASSVLINNRCEGNARNGIHADNGASAVRIEGNQLIANREFGLVLDSAGSGKIIGNISRENLLGGIAIRAAAGKIPVSGNQSTLNQGPGILLDKGLSPTTYSNNVLSKNAKNETLSNSELSLQIKGESR